MFLSPGSRAFRARINALLFTQTGTGAIQRTLGLKVKDYSVTVFDFMTPSQIADVKAKTYKFDHSSAIQAAINSLALTGGDVFFPPGGYRLNSTITIGNGTASVASTINGIRLLGAGLNWGITSFVGTSGFPVTFKLFGTAHLGSSIQINGSINGVGISNISFTFDTTVGATARGIFNKGGNFGDFNNIAVISPSDFGIIDDTTGNGGSFGGQHNSWRNIYVFLSSSFPTSQGILIAPSTGVDRAFDSWENVNVVMSSVTHVGIQFQNCDSIKLYNLQFNTAAATAVAYNYNTVASFPNGIVIFGMDQFDNTVINVGSAPTNTNFMNTIYALSQDNGAALPSLANLSIINGIQATWTPTLLGSTVAGSPTYTVQVGSYERNGRQVIARFNIQTSALGGPTGNMQIGGLPFATASTTNDFGSCTLGAYSGVTLGGGYTTLAGILGAGASTIILQESGSGVGTLAIPVTGFAASTILIGFCIYHV